MMKRLSVLLCSLLLVFGTAGSAFALLYEYTEVINLSEAEIRSVTDSSGNPGKEIHYISEQPITGPVHFYDDDVIRFNLSFLNGWSIKLEDLGQPFLGNNEGLFCTFGIWSPATSWGHDTQFEHTFTSYSGDLLVNPAITNYINSSPPPENWMEENLTNSSFMFDSFTYELTFSNPLFPPDIAQSGHGMGIYFEFAADDISVIPEPTTMLLLGSGILGLAGFRRKFRKK